MSDVTQILSAIEQGDPRAAEELLPLVYDELRKLAVAKMAQEKPGQTLQATALVHEAYMRLVEADQAQHWNSRGHFFGAAAEAMRRILARGPNNTVIGEYPTSHQQSGWHLHGGFPMTSGFSTVLPPNSPKCNNGRGEWQWGVFPPDSFHPGGVNVAMADGSLRLVSDSIDTGDLSQTEAAISHKKASPYGVWGALGTKAGNESAFLE